MGARRGAVGGRARAWARAQARAGAAARGVKKFLGRDARPAGGHSDLSGPNFFQAAP
jgi:hypothetical protein